MITNETEWLEFRRCGILYQQTRNADTAPLRLYIRTWIRRLSHYYGSSISRDILFQLLKSNQRRKIEYWKSTVDYQQELWIILLKLIQRLSIPNTHWKKSWQIFEWHFVLALADRIRSTYKKRLVTIPYEDIFPTYDLFWPRDKLTEWQKYFMSMRCGYNLSELQTITKLTYKQLYNEDRKLWTLLQEIS